MNFQQPREVLSAVAMGRKLRGPRTRTLRQAPRTLYASTRSVSTCLVLATPYLQVTFEFPFNFLDIRTSFFLSFPLIYCLQYNRSKHLVFNNFQSNGNSLLIINFPICMLMWIEGTHTSSICCSSFVFTLLRWLTLSSSSWSWSSSSCNNKLVTTQINWNIRLSLVALIYRVTQLLKRHQWWLCIWPASLPRVFFSLLII